MAIYSRCRIKICGLTSINDALHASHSGADAVGLVFYPRSPRYLGDLGLAAEIASEVGAFTDVVALFVDAAPTEIETVLTKVAVNCIQFHGNESPEFCAQFSRPYIKALRMKPGVDIAELAASYGSARGILLDAYRRGVPGGTGRTFNWDLIPASTNHLILAGGLTPENVASAVESVSPYAVDVSGGVEAAPGKKDAQKVESFIRNCNVGELK